MRRISQKLMHVWAHDKGQSPPLAILQRAYPRVGRLFGRCLIATLLCIASFTNDMAQPCKNPSAAGCLCLAGVKRRFSSGNVLLNMHAQAVAQHLAARKAVVSESGQVDDGIERASQVDGC